MRRPIGVLASLTVVAVICAGGSVAQAQVFAPQAGTCIFDRLAGTFTPGSQDVLPDASELAARPADIEQGGYTFGIGVSSSVICAGVFDGVNRLAVRAWMRLQGQFDNVVCGTGFAHDLDGSDSLVNGADRETGAPVTFTKLGHEIVFAGGLGTMRIGPNGAQSLVGLGQDAYRSAGLAWPDHPGNTGPADLTHGNLSSPYTGAGVVHITPGANNSDLVANNCVASSDGKTDYLRVSGAFVAVGA